MIVELFGPPGAGKSTFARALAARLRELGHCAELIPSARPREEQASLASASSLERLAASIGGVASLRVIRAAAQAMDATIGANSRENGDAAAALLAKAFHPKDFLRSIRLRQYAHRLMRRWDYASKKNGVVIFDQAYVQLLVSYVLLSRQVGDEEIEKLIDVLPKADLLIKVDEDAAVIEQRLRDREREQSYIERFLELGLQTNLESIDVVFRLERLLRRRGVETCDGSSLDGMFLQRMAKAASAIVEENRGRTVS